MTWRASEGDVYYFIDRFIEVQKEIDYGDRMDDKHHRIGNYFKTKELAEVMANKLKGTLGGS